MTKKPAQVKDYLAAHGGPFYELQRQLGLLEENAFRSGPRAALFVGIAWGVPLLLSLVTGHAFGPLSERPFLLDPGPAARFFVAIGLFMLMELQVEQKLRIHLNQFVRAPLIAPDSIPDAARIVSDALRQRDGRLAEIVCLALAVLLTVLSFTTVMEGDTDSWRMQMVDGVARLTAAGWWCLLVSGPIFWFLMLRWLWRHQIWARLLRRLSTLELRLVTSHPDGNGGLGFIGQYPNVYSTFVFALSCVVGAAIANQLLHGTLSLQIYTTIMTVWLAIVLAIFAWPLLAFMRPLSKLKEQTSLLASSQATNRSRALERETLGRNVSDPEMADDNKSSDIADPAKVYESAQKLSTMVIRREALVPISAAALLPLVIAGATQLPLKELVSVAKHLLLL